MSTEIKLPKQIYIVEDDVFIGKILTEKISETNINVKRFINAEDALKSLQTEVPDIILLDIYLPGMDGIKALETIRKNEATQKIIVIVLSNTDDKKYRDAAKNLGAKFLIKAAIEPSEVLKYVIDVFNDPSKEIVQ